MNLPVFTRKFLRFQKGLIPPSRIASAIEPLEARIAPATLVSPTSVSYQDGNGDTVTVTISRPLFKMGLINKVFTFDSGTVNGSNSSAQQLETLDLTWLGQAASGMNVSITVPTVNNGPVNVGYINSSGIDLGAVTVGGDLGRIAAGDFAFTKPGLASLTVDSMGALGATTQAAGGNLNTLISGHVGSITVDGDIDNADIGIGGGVHGLLGALKVTGSINGGSADFSGSIRTQGGITSVEIDGSINGGAGDSSGIIGTAGGIGSVLVEGSVTGGNGAFSGAILSTGNMGMVRIDGALTGGSGANSGQVGTSSSIASVFIGTSVFGGGGLLSGTILATHNIGPVTITDSMLGGAGQSSGQVGSAGNIGAITIGTPIVVQGVVLPDEDVYQGIDSGSAPYSGIITAKGNISSVTINGTLQGSFNGTEGSPGEGPSIFAGHDIGNISVSETVFDAGIMGKNIGAVVIDGSLEGGSEIKASEDLTSLTVNMAPVSTDRTLDGFHTDSVTNIGPGMVGISITVDGSIGSITVGASRGYDAILGCIFHVKGNIGSIDATSAYAIDTNVYGIEESAFDAGGSIGAINSTGSIDRSIFVAGIDLGPSFGFTDAGTFNNSAAAAIGYGSVTSSLAAHIGNITVTDGGSTAVISDCTFLAGVHGPGTDKTFGTMDDSVPKASSIGTIASVGGLMADFFESGTIGAPTSSSTATGTTFLQTA